MNAIARPLRRAKKQPSATSGMKPKQEVRQKTDAFAEAKKVPPPQQQRTFRTPASLPPLRPHPIGYRQALETMVLVRMREDFEKRASGEIKGKLKGKAKLRKIARRTMARHVFQVA